MSTQRPILFSGPMVRSLTAEYHQQTPEITMRQALDYEVRASGWAQYISWPWLQELSSSYFAWRVRRRYGRYTASVAMTKRITKTLAAGAGIPESPGVLMPSLGAIHGGLPDPPLQEYTVILQDIEGAITWQYSRAASPEEAVEQAEDGWTVSIACIPGHHSNLAP
jgi:hypothetical protein